jgi:hypothetical protein
VCILLLRLFKIKIDKFREDGCEIQLDEFREDKDVGNHYVIGISQRIDNMKTLNTHRIIYIRKLEYYEVTLFLTETGYFSLMKRFSAEHI